MNTEAMIAQLEALGYDVTPPRDRQSEWEMKVGMLLQSWHVIRNMLERGDAVLTQSSHTTLGIIRKEIFDEIDAAMKKDAA